MNKDNRRHNPNKDQRGGKARKKESPKSINRPEMKVLTTKEEEILSHQRPHSYITKEVRDGAYQEVLTDVRDKLSRREIIISKIVHYDYIDGVSEFVSNTIARPIPFLTGGIVVVFGGIVVVLVANYYGFGLPKSLLLILFLIGWFIGLLAELIANLVDKQNK